MINKQSLVAVAAILSAIGFIYFYNNIRNSPNDSDYELLALTDHEKFASGEFYSQIKDANGIENSIFTRKVKNAKTSNTRQRNIFVPAINAAAIAKFLNGNLPTTTPTGSTTIPALLSQTGAFSNLNTLEPSAGLIPYDMIEPFWSDGASKKRWMAIPNDGTHDTPEEQIQFSQDDAWNFPRGAVLIKHFELPGKRLETRFEVKGDDDVYYYLSYKWNAAQTDATLLNDSVDEDVIVNGVTQSWHYPSRNECTSCHFPQNGSVLGPKTRNLNKSIVYPSTGVEMNQLANLSELGILNENITSSTASSYPAVAAKNDLSASIEDRARTYIDVNCASCHNPQVENIAMFDARYSTLLENQNIIYGDVIYDEGLDNPKVIIPQNVPNSMAHFRMNSTQTGIEMPPLAKDVVDIEGVQLIASWINSLTPTNSTAPVAAFSASTVYGAAPLSVSFDATASTDVDGDALTFTWNFGDSNSAEGVNVNHVFTNTGSYTATLTVSDGVQSDQATTSIVVNNNNPGSDTVAFTDGTNLIAQDNFSGLAMGVIDMNGDGKDDIVQFNSARNLRIQYQNTPGQAFTSYSYGQVSSRNQWSTAIADFDQNGYNDILSGGAYDELKIITNNNGNDSFSLAILPSSNIFIQGSNFVDIDNDGWADIFACHDDAESRAYQNNQDGTFSFDENLLSTETDPASDNSGNYASMWIDYDNDRDLDLYISKCRGGVTSSSDPRRINMLWQNDGNNNFTEVADQANLKIGDQTWLTDFGDIDNDGDLDAIVINHGTGPNLMRNNGDGTFTEVTDSSGLLPTLLPSNLYGIQGFFRDFNNDGHLDLMVSGNNHYIFYNNGDGTFQNATNPFNSNQIQSFSIGDLNHDGFLDLYAGYANGLNSPSSTKDRIWLNEGNSNNYLNIQLKGTESNINGIGARVELYGAWGIQIRDVRSGEGYGLVNSYTQHFGIGVNTKVDKVVVRWPSGIVDEIPNPSINQFLNIVENEELRENIALNKAATQSSTSNNGDASRAVDGNTNGVYSQASTTHTNQETNAWWRVDLGNTYELSTVKVFNRTDCCTERLDLAKVYVSTTNSNNPADYEEIGVLNASGQQNLNDLAIVGRYIMVYQEQNQFLSLAEVQAYGELVLTNVTGISINPEEIIINEGLTQLITATVVPADADDTAVFWTSSDTNIATVDLNGLVTAVTKGTATITGTTNDGGFIAEANITVLLPVNAVSVNPDSFELEEGNTRLVAAEVSPSNASDTSVSWASSDTTIATVSANGSVTAIAAGIATITANTNDGNFTAIATITVVGPVSGVTVNPQTLNLVEGDAATLIAQVNPANALDTSVTWFSSDTAIATVNTNGRVNAIAAGNATITVTTTDGGFIAAATITVIRPTVATTGVSVNQDTTSLNPGNTTTLTAQVSPANASNTSVSWASSDNNIATVNASGLVTAIAIGTITITVTTQDGDYTAEANITVIEPTIDVTSVRIAPESATIVEATTQQLTATILPSDATDLSLSWSSSNEAIATVDSNGLVIGVSQGTATITVTTDDGGFTAESILNILSAVPIACAEHIIMEVYENVPGVSVAELKNHPNFPDAPSSTSELSKMLIPYNSGENYGVRIKGLLKAPETGTYYFWVTGDDHVELNLSTNDASINTTRIAYHEAWSGWNQWNKYPSQKSVAITLIAGENYYIEALMNEFSGADYLSVGWRRPSDGSGTEPAQLIPCNVFDTFATPSFVNVTGVAITPTSVSLTTTETTTLTANVSPANATNSSVTWSSADTSIATVAPNGLVTAISQGTVSISAQTIEGGFVSESTILVTDSNPNDCSNRIVMETFANVPGFSIAQLKNNVNFPNSPSSTSSLSSFIIPYNAADNYGVRVKGLLKAPETGTYYFWITGDDNVELSLSSDTNSDNKLRIAYHERWSGWNQWNKYTTQKSVGIDLIAGQNYYIEALMNELAGSDYLSVGWRRPSDGNGTEPAQLIPCDVFDTYIQSQSLIVALSQLPQEKVLDFFLSPNPATDQVWISLVGFDQANEMTYSIYDTSGKKVLKGSGGIEEIINISSMPPGVYLVIVKSGNWSERKKLIVR